MRSTALTVVLLCTVALAPVARAEDEGFQIIISEKNPVSSLAVTDVQLMFLKSIPLWPKGMKVRPVDLPVGSTVRQAFSRKVMGKDASAVCAYWDHQVFTGDSVPPTVLPDDKAVVAFVAENPGAIGYVSVSANLQGPVKAIRLNE